MRVLVPSAVLAAAFAAASCAPINPLPRFGFDEVSREEQAIAAEMRGYTSRVEVYRQFRTLFTARSLYLAPAVRKAAAGFEAKSRLLDPAETKALTDRIVAPGAEKAEFLIGFYSPEEARSRLEDPAGGWEILLRLADGRRLKATCLLAGAKEGDPFMRFLRWDLSWSRLYRVCFPISPEDPALLGTVTLLLAGPEGSGEMPFTLPGVAPSAAPAP